MNKTAIAALTLVVAALPLAPAALASDRYDSRDRHHAQPGWRDGGHYDHDHGYRDQRWHPYWHNGRRYWHDHAEWRHDRHDRHHYQDDNRVRVVVPLPLPPLPVIVLDKHRHGH